VKIAYLILAHAHPQQVQRLVGKLASPNAHCYIHLDQKQDVAPFLSIFQLPGVFFVSKRVKVSWASYSMIEATLRGFEAILESKILYSHVTLLSGQDYPIKSEAAIFHFLGQHPQHIFIQFEQIECEWKEAIPRIKKYHLVSLRIPFGKYRLERVINKLLPSRKLPNEMVAVGRSQWFTAPLECIAYLLRFINENQNVANFFKLSWAPDEILFQTILYNSQYKEYMVNDNLVYMDWTEKKASPKTLTIHDAAALANTNKLFARKFNQTDDRHILDYIDSITN